MVVGEQACRRVPHVRVVPCVAGDAEHAFQAGCAHAAPVAGHPRPQGGPPGQQLLLPLVPWVLGRFQRLARILQPCTDSVSALRRVCMHHQIFMLRPGLEPRQQELP